MFTLEETTITKIQNAFNSGELSSFDLTAMYLERMAEIDKSGPRLNSVLEVNPEALFIAEAMDRERVLKGKRSILHGVPILVKDAINTHDKMHTSAGSIALANHFASYDATVVKKLRDAGAVILGKTNMTEFGNYMTKMMKNGYSSRGGQVISPYNPQGNPWGSSTGSAVAVSANLCAAALGVETNGSVIWPAHNNAVVGVKPTLGAVSRYGVIPITTAQDTVGVIARTVEDAAALLGFIVGYDERDVVTWSRDGQVHSDYTQFLDPGGLRGLRVGVNKGNYDELNTEQRALADGAFEVLSKCGAYLVHGADLPRLRCDREILFYEFKQSLNAYLSTCGPSLEVRTLRDIINANNARPDLALKFGQAILLDAEHETSGTLMEAEYLRNRVAYLRKARQQGIDRVLDEVGADLYVSPGLSDASPISGYPSIVVPVGFTSDNMPFGLTFVGRAFSEPLLLKSAYAFEQAMGGRRPPIFEMAKAEKGDERAPWDSTMVGKIN